MRVHSQILVIVLLWHSFTWRSGASVAHDMPSNSPPASVDWIVWVGGTESNPVWAVSACRVGEERQGATMDVMPMPVACRLLCPRLGIAGMYLPIELVPNAIKRSHIGPLHVSPTVHPLDWAETILDATERATGVTNLGYEVDVPVAAACAGDYELVLFDADMPRLSIRPGSDRRARLIGLSNRLASFASDVWDTGRRHAPVLSSACSDLEIAALWRDAILKNQLVFRQVTIRPRLGVIVIRTNGPSTLRGVWEAIAGRLL